MNEREIAIDFITSEFDNSICKNIENHIEDKKNEILDYIFMSKAWNDAMIYAKKHKGYANIKEKQESVLNYIKNKFNELSSNVNYDVWCKEALLELSCNFFDNRYGVTQKYFNMSIKYIYFIEKGYDFNLFSNIFFKRYERNFDIPIDSFVLKWLIYNSIDDEEILEKAESITSWNGMNKDIYPFLQSKLKNKMREMYSGYDSDLFIETHIWDKIKYLKSELHMEL